MNAPCASATSRGNEPSHDLDDTDESRYGRIGYAQVWGRPQLALCSLGVHRGYSFRVKASRKLLKMCKAGRRGAHRACRRGR
jgi:hypothetical protein